MNHFIPDTWRRRCRHDSMVLEHFCAGNVLVLLASSFLFGRERKMSVSKRKATDPKVVHVMI